MTFLELEAKYCSGCNEYKGVVSFAELREYYPDTYKEIVYG
jgi:hypothetical protein